MFLVFVLFFQFFSLEKKNGSFPVVFSGLCREDSRKSLIFLAESLGLVLLNDMSGTSRRRGFVVVRLV